MNSVHTSLEIVAREPFSDDYPPPPVAVRVDVRCQVERPEPPAPRGKPRGWRTTNSW